MLIFDASTLILTAKMELLDALFASSSFEVAVPTEVEKECCRIKKTLDALQIQKAIDDSRIRVIAVSDRKLVAKLEHDFSLGRGEAEAIALAVLKKADVLAIDDKNGINACKLLSIRFTTAAGMLVRCREKHLLSREEALSRVGLLEKFGRYKRSILDDVRARLEACK
jgi:predicted nucleic acid-binding protein